MKNKTTHIFLIILLLINAGSCKKENASTPVSGPAPSIKHQWELQRSVQQTYINGSLTSSDTTYHTSGDLRILFREDLTYVEYANLTPSDSGYYSYEPPHITLTSGSDSATFEVDLQTNSLILKNENTVISSPDTYTFRGELSFSKIN